MNKKVLMIAGGAGGALAVAAALYFFMFSGGGEEAQALEFPAVEPTPVVVPGKLGPHITLEGQVYTLFSKESDPRYVRLEILIEFETYSEDWAHVLHGCVFASEEEGGVGPCKAEENHLLAEFEEEIGTGRELIQDAVTSIVSAKSYEDVGSPQGKEALRAEILHAVEDLIHEPHVTRVLFLEFLTQ